MFHKTQSGRLMTAVGAGRSEPVSTQLQSIGRGANSIGAIASVTVRAYEEKRFQQEIRTAYMLQCSMLPRYLPPLETLDYAGSCEQAWTVGGDYYDFLDLGKGRVGFVLADVSGKGVSAALLMANLQASLRSHSTTATENLPGSLEAVNRLFRESARLSHFATLFFADYSDESRKLRYVNCGHEPAFLVRADGHCDRLSSNATVLGLFEDWRCTVGEVTLLPGDTLVVYSDGVTEAMSEANEFFGYQRLLDAIHAHPKLPAAELLGVISSAARKFSGEEPGDDLTLLVARAR